MSSGDCPPGYYLNAPSGLEHRLLRTVDFKLQTTNYKLQTLLASGCNPAASAQSEAFAAGPAMKLGAFNQSRSAFDAAAFKIDPVRFLYIGAVAHAETAERRNSNR